MSKRIVIATHGPLAKGFEESMKFILQPEDPIHTICAFTEHPDPGAAFDKIFESFDEGDKVIVLTDLSGGSVNKMIAERLGSKKFYLLTGLNLALLLEIAAADESEVNDEFLRDAVGAAGADAIFVNDKVMCAEDESEDSFF